MLVAAFSTVGFANPVEINFDDQVDGTVITTQYAGVVFSSTSGNVNYVTTQPEYESTPPNFICTGPVRSSIDCTADTFLNFSSPVNGLNFDGMGVNNDGVVALIDVYTNGTFNSTVDVTGAAQGIAPDHIDLSAFSNITEIHIYDITDGGGIGWDTFRYDQGSTTTTTPEPASVVLLGSALILAGIALRKRLA